MLSLFKVNGVLTIAQLLVGRYTTMMFPEQLMRGDQPRHWRAVTYGGAPSSRCHTPWMPAITNQEVRSTNIFVAARRFEQLQLVQPQPGNSGSRCMFDILKSHRRDSAREGRDAGNTYDYLQFPVGRMRIWNPRTPFF